MPSNKWFISYLMSSMASGLTNPMIPLFVVVYLHSNVFFVGVASAVSSAASVPALIFWGNLSDSLSRRKVFILIGFFGAFASFLPIFFVRNIYEYMAILILFQVLAMASVPVSTVMILEQNDRSQWPQVISNFSMISGVGSVIGLVIGTVFITLEYSPSALPLVYILSSIIYLIAGVTAIKLISEPGRHITRNDVPLHTFRVVERARYFPTSVIHFLSLSSGKNGENLDKNVFLFITMTAFLMFGFQLFFVPYPVMVIKFGGNNILIFVMYALNSLLSTISFMFTGRIVTRLGGKTSLFIAVFSRVIIFSAAAAIPMFLYGTYALVSAVAVYAVLGGIWSIISVSQTNYISRNSGQKARGKAIGLYNSLLGVGQILGGLTSGIITTLYGYSIDYITSALIIMAGLVIMMKIYRGEKIFSFSKASPDKYGQC
ncbi:TVG0233936 [Thermoplasma volcanium GSS1]|uniref:TVG0233936 protein n=1 Tax=Thermoplasma volcanium (strain ATCC 51530 / DSM 4299 / JCM 9571 / NBRC 15438 / GSS1) TaxID=273116 RepID=Q97C76_THEVO|nr:MFS transporter [Thermoplasma volcanium]BAB59369.1 TVG0233936 [Thermoplasma volcanium GSS1]